MGHVWLGFGEEQMREMLTEAGFEHIRIVTLPTDPKTKGPALFVVRGHKREEPRKHEDTKIN